MFQKIREFFAKLLGDVDKYDKATQDAKAKANEKANEIIAKVQIGQPVFGLFLVVGPLLHQALVQAR